ncbi:hypothetical protein BMR04_13590 [Methylococcaceae bacterium HT3]|nr:hypothetical protein BMR04_13590 [Methylococcaceae bacterium HT3]
MKKLKLFALSAIAILSTSSMADHVTDDNSSLMDAQAQSISWPTSYTPFVPNPYDDPYVGEWNRQRTTAYYILDENMKYKKLEHDKSYLKPYLEPANFLKYHNRRVILDKNPLNVEGGDISVDFTPTQINLIIEAQFVVKRHDIVILTKRRFDNLVNELVYYKSLLDGE